MYIIDGTSEHADQIGYSADNINWSYPFALRGLQTSKFMVAGLLTRFAI